MSKTFKDRPGKYKKEIRRPREKRFVKTKGREKKNIKSNLELYNNYEI